MGLAYQAVQHDAKRKHIVSDNRGCARESRWAGIVLGHGWQAFTAVLTDQPRNAEIQQPEPTASIDHQVRGLQVCMND